MSRKILLTGATGVVGLSILELLDKDDKVHILTRSKTFNILPPGVVNQLPGNICVPDFGLSEAQINSLGSLDFLIHSAALTDFTADADVLSEINMAGLEHAIALAKKLNVHLIYISTAFVKGRDGHALNNYEDSKRQAEQLLNKSLNKVTVVRPSVIIGDTKLGIMPKKQGMHNMLKLAIKEVIPVIPGDAKALVDVVPRDVVAESILTIVDNQLKGEYWITAGTNSSTLKEMMSMTQDPKIKEKYGFNFKAPKLINPNTFERLIKPVFMPALPRRFKRMFEETSIYLKYLDMTEPFPSDIEKLRSYKNGPKDFNVTDLIALNIAGFDRVHPLNHNIVEAEQ